MASGLFLDSKHSTAVPLQFVRASAKIRQFATQVQLVQNYLLTGGANATEVYYVFPLQDQAAVYEFFVTVEHVLRNGDSYKIVDSDLIKGLVKDKNTAKQDYENAKKQGKKSAALLEQTRSHIFSLSFFVNGYQPAEAFDEHFTRVTVNLGYVAELEQEIVTHDDDSKEAWIRFMLPTTIAPKYTPPSAPNSAIPNVVYTGDVAHRLVLDVEMDMTNAIDYVKSPSHEEVIATKDVTMKKGKVFVQRTNTVDMDKDFVLNIKLQSVPIVEAILEEYVGETSGMEKYALMVPIVPNVTLQPTDNSINTEIIMVIDWSGSMEGLPIQQAFRSARLVLASLPACYFNILFFGDTFIMCFDKSQLFNDNSLQVARKFLLENESSCLGGTEIYEPLEHVFKNVPKLPGCSRQLFLLTDGEVSNTEQVIALCRDHVDTTRIFTFGIGENVDQRLVNGCAKAGEGAAVYISSNEKIEPKIISQLKRALQPSVADVNILWPTSTKWRPCYTFIRPVFYETKNVIYLFADDLPSDPFQVAVQYSDPVTQQIVSSFITVDPSQSQKDKVIHCLAAKAEIQELEDYPEVVLRKRQRTGPKEEITRLGVKYQLTSSQTSFVAVSEKYANVAAAATNVVVVPQTKYDDEDLFITRSSSIQDDDDYDDAGLEFCSEEEAEDDDNTPRSDDASPSLNFSKSESMPMEEESVQLDFFGATKGAMIEPEEIIMPAKKYKAKSDDYEDLSRDIMADAAPVRKSKLLNTYASVAKDIMDEKETIAPSKPSSSFNFLSNVTAMFKKSAPVSAPAPMAQMQSQSMAAPKSVAPASVKFDDATIEPLKKKEEMDKKPTSTKGSSTSVKLDDLIFLQLAEGSWELDAKLAKVLGQAQLAAHATFKTKVWGTAICIAVLRGKFAASKDEWELVEQRAIKFLKKESGMAALTEAVAFVTANIK